MRLPPWCHQVPAANPTPKSQLPTLRENAVEISESVRLPRPCLRLSSDHAEAHLLYPTHILPIAWKRLSRDCRGGLVLRQFPPECGTTQRPFSAVSMHSISA